MKREAQERVREDSKQKTPLKPPEQTDLDLTSPDVATRGPTGV